YAARDPVLRRRAAADQPHHGYDQSLVRGDGDSGQPDRERRRRSGRRAEQDLRARVLPAPARQGAEAQEQVRLLHPQMAAARRNTGLDTRLMFARALFMAVVLALALLGAQAGAQDAYPSKPITLIVPFPPGGVADIVARPAADALGRVLGAPVVIENKAGAGGGIGMAYVAKAKPDGYTLLLALSSISILPEADKIIGRPPMYQLDQLVPIARLTADPTVLAVRADSPWKTLQEFVADAKKRPGAISYGSSGNYGTMHVPMEMFASDAGIKLLHVPYTGAGPAVVGLLGGNIDAVAS